ncbi:hypothetical protein [Clostridium sartagoforme]|uniref:hypothetical protein n=1 Tax=Clostridium sartagoforme TaxID=84031 RepID=UPI0031DFA157
MFDSSGFLKAGYVIAIAMFLFAVIINNSNIEKSDLDNIKSDEFIINFTKLIVYGLITYFSYKVFTSIEIDNIESLLSCVVSIAAAIETSHSLYNLIGKYLSYAFKILLKSMNKYK